MTARIWAAARAPLARRRLHWRAASRRRSGMSLDETELDDGEDFAARHGHHVPCARILEPLHAAGANPCLPTPAPPRLLVVEPL
jgi:hypothetical protein